jgi:hypothetical protein
MTKLKRSLLQIACLTIGSIASAIGSVKYPIAFAAGCQFPNLAAIVRHDHSTGYGKAPVKIIVDSLGGQSDIAFAKAVVSSLEDLRRTNVYSISSVAIASNESSWNAATDFINNSGEYDEFVMLDSAFMSGGAPKYKSALTTYKNAHISPNEIMIIDPFPPIADRASFVQITEKGPIQSTALLVEIAATLLADPGLSASTEFMSYARNMSEIQREQRPPSDSELRLRNSLVADCINTISLNK